MFIIDGVLTWSATDLTLAAECEYALLRALDYKLGRAEAEQAPDDPFMKHIGALGDLHEARLLDELQATREVMVLKHVDGYSRANVEAARDATIAAFTAQPDVIAQAAFFDGEFFGYADFVQRTSEGWMISDAKLARSAKPKALIQLGAYADQVASLGLPVADRVSLLLGTGEPVYFPTADVLPVFRERRARLRTLLAGHQTSGTPVAWGDDSLMACGTCVECEASAASHHDVILVAGLRMDQRSKLHAEGITTIHELAIAPTRPTGMAQATFDKLQAQARMQQAQRDAGPGATPTYELTARAAKMLALLPAPSEGDLFFDFEGDPLYDEGDPSRVGLEYLWGVMDTAEKYDPIWAHSSLQERAAFVRFMDDVAARRAAHPDMHIYHYAPYETSALKRLAMRYQTKEKELDDLLRSEVFVDLYATVRGSVRISQPSYSIKKLEPLYMAEDELREGDVADGAGSIVAYAEYRDLLLDLSSTLGS